MRKFRVTGIDRDSGFDTTLVIDAIDKNAAEMEAVRRGVAVRSAEPSDSTERVRRPLHSRLWFQIAGGVCVGLFAYSMIVSQMGRSWLRANSTAPPMTPARSASRSEWFQLDDMAFRINERDGAYWELAWRISVENVSAERHYLTMLRIQFIDAEGFEMGNDHQYGVEFPTGMRDVTGSLLVAASQAARIVDFQVFTTE